MTMVNSGLKGLSLMRMKYTGLGIDNKSLIFNYQNKLFKCVFLIVAELLVSIFHSFEAGIANAISSFK